MIARELIAIPSYAEEVETGLLSHPKTLPTKLLYDAAGSALFEEITSLPEYYLTRTELGILKDRASDIAAAAGQSVTIVELGAGTAAKTCTLLRAFTRRQMRVPYHPIDISSSALAEARERVLAESPGILVKPVVADFSQGFGFLRDIPGRKLVLYLGSSIGNFDPEAAIEMLRNIRIELSDSDGLLLGTDMVKHPRFLVPAYNDASGVTAEFSKNILRRLNSELVADFDLDSFQHVALWNPKLSRMEIYLESCCRQVVHLGLLQMRVGFERGERIHTENSYKYTMSMVRDLLGQSGYRIRETWFDSQRWFGLHLATV